MRKEACLGHFGKAELGWEFWTLGGIHSVLRRERRSYGDTHTHTHGDADGSKPIIPIFVGLNIH